MVASMTLNLRAWLSKLYFFYFHFISTLLKIYSRVLFVHVLP